MSSQETPETPETPETVIVVGAGQAGGWAATTLRTAGFSGRLVLVGEEPHLPYERPPLSKGLLAGKQEPEHCHLKPAEHYAEAGIELRLGVAATDLDRAARRLALADGEHLAYDRLLLATGSRVRKLPLPGAELPGIFYLRDLGDALALRARLRPGVRVVLVGGGYIGLEVASTAGDLGCRVWVLETMPTIMARVVPEVISAWLAARHRARGLTIETGVRVTAFEAADGALAVACADGRRFPADVVVVGIGIQPNDELAAAAGIATDNGILVDERGRTSDPRIYAAGDVAHHVNPLLGRRIRLESWQNAQNQAMAVAKAMCGEAAPYADVPWFWSDQAGINLQMVGHPERWGQVVLRGDTAGERFSAFCLEDGRLAAAIAVNQPRDLHPARKWIRERTVLDPRQLADPEVNLKRLA